MTITMMNRSMAQAVVISFCRSPVSVTGTITILLQDSLKLSPIVLRGKCWHSTLSLYSFYSVAGALFNLNTQYRTVVFLANENYVHITGQPCPVRLLKVKLGHVCFQPHPSQFVTSVLPSDTL